MKILFTPEIFPPEYTGGGEVLCLKIIKELIERGFRIKVLTTGDPKIHAYQNIETLRIPINRYLMTLTFPMITNYARKFDLIQTFSGNSCFPSWIASKVVNKPICCYVHHILTDYWKDIRGFFVGSTFQFMEKLFLTRPYDAIIFQNQTSKNLGLKMGLDENKTYLLQPGIDYKKYNMKKIKKEKFVLFVGNFRMDQATCKNKGLNYLIEAARKLPKIKFIIVGEGTYLDVLKKIAPSNVFFTGTVKEDSLIELYNKASIFCLPSLTEGFGLSILEAMASGCSIVSTIDIGQEGILIRPKNYLDIFNNVEYLIENPTIIKKMGNKNRQLSKKYTWTKFINQLIEIYSLIVK